MSEGDEYNNDILMINCLNPVELLVLPIVAYNKRYDAMIDSGSTYSLIKKSLIDTTKIHKCNRELKVYGGQIIKVEGIINVNIKLSDYELEHTFWILEDSCIKTDLVLGLDFLTTHKMTVNLEERSFIMTGNRKEIVMKLNEEGELKKMKCENIPVYAATDVLISSESSELVLLDVPNLSEINCEYIFNPKEDEQHQYYCGVISEGVDKVICKNKSRKTIKVKKGTQIGELSMLKEEDEDESDNFDEYWTNEMIEKHISLSECNLSNEQKDKVYNMLLKVKNSLSKGDNDIGEVQMAPHQIKLEEYKPIWQKPRSFAPPIQEEIEKQCQELLSSDIIEYSQSRWSSPCVPVRKSDGSLRLCIDYRRLNAITKTENFPMPNLTNCIYRGSKVKFFTKLDLVRGYYQVSLDEESKELTAFSTVENHYQFKRLAFGLKNSGIAFQRMMQQLLSSLNTSRVVVYIDDILIMSSSFEEHIDMVHKVLLTLERYKIKIKVKKCEFFKEEVNFLGQILSNKGIRKSPDYIKKVTEFEDPTTVKELRQFLGLVNFQRKFINKCSEITKPLSMITGGNNKEKIDWTEERKMAFNRLKEEIRKDVILSYPDYSQDAEELELFVDASGIGAGGILMQRQGGDNKVIGYGSMCFSSTQRNYSTIERELCAIRWGCEHFKPFIYGISFKLYTDHKPLTFMRNMSLHSSRIARTLEELSEYNFSIKYLPGSDNIAADFLSRMNSNTTDEHEEREGLPKEFKIIEKIEGGGNSMFKALIVAIQYEYDGELVNVPDDHLMLRKAIFEEIIDNMGRYKIPVNKMEKRKLKMMSNNDQLPSADALLAASYLYKLEIRVYHDMRTPVIFVAEPEMENKVINLQCIAGIHYNPIHIRKQQVIEKSCKLVNCMYNSEDNEKNEYNQECDLEKDNLFETAQVSMECSHSQSNVSIIASYNDVSICALVDTGAQISIIGDDTFYRIRKGDEVIETDKNIKLKAIGGFNSEILGIVSLNIQIGNNITDFFPFAIVKQSNLPCCLLLGLNFLKNNKYCLDFGRSCIERNNDNKVDMSINVNNSYVGYSNNIIANEDNHGVEVKLLIKRDQLHIMQKSNHAIRMLKYKILKNVPVKHWKNGSLNQFKRYLPFLRVEEDLVVKVENDCNLILVSYPLMVEIVYTIHNRIGHLGRQKLVEMVKRQFWHPAIDQISRDICRSCKYCQMNKSHALNEKPPTLKVDASFPFNIVAMDLVKFPRSKKGNEVALVVIDHFSKWMLAVPLKNKTSISVASALKCDIFPNMIRMPLNILTDNGKEFTGKETEGVLKCFDVKHLYSSPYTPSSNGAVERVNQTLIGIIKALSDDLSDWDKVLHRAVIIYNQTYHNQIKCSPADFIMTKQHGPSNQIIMEGESQENWREGNPNFKSFKKGQKVIKKIQRVGNYAKYKLMEKYDGPYTVVKIQSNGVSYEIMDEDEKIIKAHHNKLRPYYELSDRMRRFLPVEDKENLNEADHLNEGGYITSQVTSSNEVDDDYNDDSASECSDDVGSAKNDETGSFINNNEELIKGKIIISDIECNNNNDYKNSTPRFDSDRINDCLMMDVFSIIEQHLTINEEMSELIEMSLFNLNSDVQEVTNILDRRIDQVLGMTDIEQEISVIEAPVNTNNECRSLSLNESVNHVREHIKEIKDIIEAGKRGLAEGRNRSMNIRRQIWEHRRSKIDETGNESRLDNVTNEMSDFLPEMRAFQSSTPRRVLRSQGKVQEYPNVQHRTLEYKMKKMSLK